MNPERSTTEADRPLLTEIDCCDRWQVYFRLQELDIPCQCRAHRPLSVDIRTATMALQVWSIVNRVSRPHQELATWLNQCWALKSNS
ncbi:MAG: hypothetical protein O2890_09855 [Cyanobacteria bacterium]|nr:hypothetical protein [Cyanobacteriota bacterium]MDA0866706.1 hypothetical protein [Cyanobacteriota bacterium]